VVIVSSLGCQAPTRLVIVSAKFVPQESFLFADPSFRCDVIPAGAFESHVLFSEIPSSSQEQNPSSANQFPLITTLISFRRQLCVISHAQTI